MVYKVPYTSIGGRHRPYLEVVFWNEGEKKASSRTFGMIDSGADHTVLPYSMGLSIGLSTPSESEKLANVSGVGGNLSYIERTCRIYVLDKKTNMAHGFNDTVWWIYPDAEMEKERDALVASYQEMEKFQDQCKPNTPLHQHFEDQKQQVIGNLNKISNRLEVSVLLGRPFFNNFDYLQFFHKDRVAEDKCFFNFEITQDKIVHSLPITVEQPKGKGLKGKVDDVKKAESKQEA